MPQNKRANKNGFLSKQNSAGNVSRTRLRKKSLPTRSRASLRARVLSALRDSRKRSWSSRKLAGDQGCSHTYVEKLRAELQNGWLRFGENGREIVAKGYKSLLAYWKSVDRLAATSVPGSVQSTSSIEYWYARQKDLLETLKDKLSAVSAALNQEQRVIADRLAAVEGGVKQVDAVLDSLKSLPIRIPDAIIRDLADQKRKQTEHEISSARTSRAKPGRKK